MLSFRQDPSWTDRVFHLLSKWGCHSQTLFLLFSASVRFRFYSILLFTFKTFCKVHNSNSLLFRKISSEETSEKWRFPFLRTKRSLSDPGHGRLFAQANKKKLGCLVAEKGKRFLSIYVSRNNDRVPEGIFWNRIKHRISVGGIRRISVIISFMHFIMIIWKSAIITMFW